MCLRRSNNISNDKCNEDYMNNRGTSYFYGVFFFKIRTCNKVDICYEQQISKNPQFNIRLENNKKIQI